MFQGSSTITGSESLWWERPTGLCARGAYGSKNVPAWDRGGAALPSQVPELILLFKRSKDLELRSWGKVPTTDSRTAWATAWDPHTQQKQNKQHNLPPRKTNGHLQGGVENSSPSSVATCYYLGVLWMKRKRGPREFWMVTTPSILNCRFWQPCGLLFPLSFTQGLKTIPPGSWFIPSQKLKDGQRPSFNCAAGISLDTGWRFNYVPLKGEFRDWRDG